MRAEAGEYVAVHPGRHPKFHVVLMPPAAGTTNSAPFVSGEARVHDNDQRNTWHARERVAPISTALNFASRGLVLGAGTVILGAVRSGGVEKLAGQEARVLALLSAAYGTAIAPSVLGNVGVQ